MLNFFLFYNFNQSHSYCPECLNEAFHAFKSGCLFKKKNNNPLDIYWAGGRQASPL